MDNNKSFVYRWFTQPLCVLDNIKMIYYGVVGVLGVCCAAPWEAHWYQVLMLVLSGLVFIEGYKLSKKELLEEISTSEYEADNLRKRRGQAAAICGGEIRRFGKSELRIETPGYDDAAHRASVYHGKIHERQDS